ncbi:MAG: 2-C-methyl-D-erythritol 4-phosphate cytidylyltransferase [Cytophagales bacterium]
MTSDYNDKIAIIVAGGSGKRMASQIPKQFLPINNLPIIFHTIKKFQQASCSIILVLPKEHINTFENLAQEYDFNLQNILISEGGNERYDSVKNGLSKINSDFKGNVAVHDAVRPLINSEKITKLFKICEDKKAVIPVVKLKDSIRQLSGEKSRHVNREDFVIVQTPQIFEFSILKKAYSSEIPTQTTDDAGLVERIGQEIFLAEGDFQNLKITTPEDLDLAEVLIKKI